MVGVPAMSDRTMIDLLRDVGPTLYGPRWQSELGRQLGFSDRAVRRWLTGEVKPPEDIAARLLALVDARIVELHTVRLRLM